jgi:hypothetical protein
MDSLIQPNGWTECWLAMCFYFFNLVLFAGCCDTLSAYAPELGTFVEADIIGMMSNFTIQNDTPRTGICTLYCPCKESVSCNIYLTEYGPGNNKSISGVIGGAGGSSGGNATVQLQCVPGGFVNPVNMWSVNGIFCNAPPYTLPLLTSPGRDRTLADNVNF